MCLIPAVKTDICTGSCKEPALGLFVFDFAEVPSKPISGFHQTFMAANISDSYCLCCLRTLLHAFNLSTGCLGRPLEAWSLCCATLRTVFEVTENFYYSFWVELGGQTKAGQQLIVDSNEGQQNNHITTTMTPLCLL